MKHILSLLLIVAIAIAANAQVQRSYSGATVSINSNLPDWTATCTNCMITIVENGETVFSGPYSYKNGVIGDRLAKNYDGDINALILSCVESCEGVSLGEGDCLDCPPGEQGIQGIPGADGQDGANGADGINCWDLNGDGVNDPSEDTNSDGQFNTLDCAGSGGTVNAMNDQIPIVIAGDTIGYETILFVNGVEVDRDTILFADNNTFLTAVMQTQCESMASATPSENAGLKDDDIVGFRDNPTTCLPELILGDGDTISKSSNQKEFASHADAAAALPVGAEYFLPNDNTKYEVR